MKLEKEVRKSCFEGDYIMIKPSLGSSVVKNLHADGGATGDGGQENALEEETAIHSSIFAWRIPWTEEPCGLLSTELQCQT